MVSRVAAFPPQLRPRQVPREQSSADFSKSIKQLAIQGNQVTLALANPYLPDCPLVGITDGFSELTGYRKDEILGRNCRFLSEGCKVKMSTRFKLREAINTDGEVLVNLRNKRRRGDVFTNVLYISAVQVSGRKYKVGIQVNDMTKDGVEISQMPDHERELQAIMDSIVGMHVERWAEKQLLDFCINLPHPYSTLLTTADESTYRNTHNSTRRNPFKYQSGYSSTTGLPVVCKNTFIEIEEPVSTMEKLPLMEKPRSQSNPNPRLKEDLACPEAVSMHHHQLRPPSPREECEDSLESHRNSDDATGAQPLAGFDQIHMPSSLYTGGAVSSSAETGRKPDNCRLVRYAPSAMMLAVGHPVDWSPEVSADLQLFRCTFSVSPPLVQGLTIQPETGVISGVVSEVDPDPSEWMYHTVTAEAGCVRCSTAIQLKVVDLSKGCRVTVLSELPGDEYMLLFSK